VGGEPGVAGRGGDAFQQGGGLSEHVVRAGRLGQRGQAAEAAALGGVLADRGQGVLEQCDRLVRGACFQQRDTEFGAGHGGHPGVQGGRVQCFAADGQRVVEPALEPGDTANGGQVPGGVRHAADLAGDDQGVFYAGQGGGPVAGGQGGEGRLKGGPVQADQVVLAAE